MELIVEFKDEGGGNLRWELPKFVETGISNAPEGDQEEMRKKFLAEMQRLMVSYTRVSTAALAIFYEHGNQRPFMLLESAIKSVDEETSQAIDQAVNHLADVTIRNLERQIRLRKP